jgi:hypothetical protein
MKNSTMLYAALGLGYSLIVSGLAQKRPGPKYGPGEGWKTHEAPPPLMGNGVRTESEELTERMAAEQRKVAGSGRISSPER